MDEEAFGASRQHSNAETGELAVAEFVSALSGPEHLDAGVGQGVETMALGERGQRTCGQIRDHGVGIGDGAVLIRGDLDRQSSILVAQDVEAPPRLDVDGGEQRHGASSEQRDGKILEARDIVLLAGLLVAPPAYDIVRTHKIPLEELDAASTGALIDKMAESIASLLKGLDSEGELHFARGVDVGYIGQSYQVTVPLDGAVEREAIWQRFATLYREKYGYFYDDVPAEIVNLRVLGELVGGELGLEPLPVEPGAAAVAAGSQRGRNRPVWTHPPARPRPARCASSCTAPASPDPRPTREAFSTASASRP